MPKIRHRKRVRSSRLDPLSRPSPSTPSTPAPNLNLPEQEILTLFSSLKSGSISAQLASAKELGNVLSWSPTTLRLFLSKNLIGVLGAKLGGGGFEGQEEEEVLEACLGCLRNLAATQPLSLLSEMINKKLFPSLLSLLPTLLPSLSSSPSAAKSASIDHLLTLFYSFTESTPKIIKQISQPEVYEKFWVTASEVLLKVKGKGEESLGLKLSAGHLLHSLLLLSPPTPKTKISPELLTSLIKILTTSNLSDEDDTTDLKILAFGSLLLLSGGNVGKGKGKGKKDDVKEVLEKNVGVLVGVLDGAKGCLESVVEKAFGSAGHAETLAALSTSLSTLGLSLEVLTSYCSTLDLSLSSLTEEEEWGGIITNNDENEDEEMAQDPSTSKDLPLPLTSVSTQTLCRLLPPILLSFMNKTKLSFVPSSTFSTSSSPSTSTTSTLIPTTTTTTKESFPIELKDLGELINMVNLRAGECLNQVFVKLASGVEVVAADGEGKGKGKGKGNSIEEEEELEVMDEDEDEDDGMIEDLDGPSDEEGEEEEEETTMSGSPSPPPSSEQFSFLQPTFDQTLDLIHELSSAREEGEDDDDRDRGLEMMISGLGVVWGCLRVSTDLMIHIPPTTQFLSALFTSSLPLSQTREGESLLVTILGILSHIGRHPTITIPQNREIGNFLLSILPPSKIEVTIQVTLQAIDGVIDLYADEDSEWDKEVFREGGFGRRLEEAVKGVRAATKKVDRKRFPELRARADGGLDNLVAFVEYRKSIV